MILKIDFYEDLASRIICILNFISFILNSNIKVDVCHEKSYSDPATETYYTKETNITIKDENILLRYCPLSDECYTWREVKGKSSYLFVT